MVDVDVHLLARERRPQQHLAALRRPVLREWQPWSRTVEGEQVGLGGAVREYSRIRQEHARVRRCDSVPAETLELRRPARHVVDDHIRHDVGVAGERAHVIPCAQTRVDARMIDRIEARVRAVNRIEEGQYVHATKCARERTRQQAFQIAKRAGGQAIDVGNQLRLVPHARVICVKRSSVRVPCPRESHLWFPETASTRRRTAPTSCT